MKNVYILLICILIFSCKATKGIKDNAKTLNLDTETIIKNHYLNKNKLKSFKGQLKVAIKSGNNEKNYDAKVRILKDEKIWISIGKVGITGAKLLITPNKVKYYNKIDKEYYDGGFSILNNWLGTTLSFNQLQAVLFGETIFELDNSNYKSEKIEQGYLLTPLNQNKSLEHYITINKSNFKIKSQEIAQNKLNRILNIEYLTYQKNENETLPLLTNLFLIDNTSESQVTIEYKNISLNQELRYPFSIPSNYKEISFEK